MIPSAFAAAEERIGAIERRILLALANHSRSSLARIAVQSGRHRLLARIKTVESSLRLTRRWSELALNPQSPQQTTLSRSSFSPTRRSWSGRKNSNLFTGGTTGSNPICSANRWLLVMRSGWDLRLPAVVPELLKAADPQTRRVPSCHSRPPGRAGRRCRRNCAGRA